MTVATVKARFESSKNVPGRGTIYYRIYKGHNRRMEFSSRIHVTASVWEELNNDENVDNDEIHEIKVRMNKDLTLLNSIINKGDYETMGDIIRTFKCHHRSK